MRSSLLLLALLGSAPLMGCSLGVERAPAESPPPASPPVEARPDVDARPAPVLSLLSSCLERRGAWVEVDRVFNNDTTDHGTLIELAVSPDQRLAAAGADGTVKIWTLEGLVGTVMAAELAYGPELPIAPAADLAFHDGRVVVADTRGLVTSWTVEGEMDVLGGTDPDVSMVAVAFDEPRGRLAQADARAHGGVLVRQLGSAAAVVGPLATTLESVSDLVFLADGRLVLAGRDADGAALEVRDAADPTRTLASLRAGADGRRVVELAAAADTVVALLDEALLVLGPTLELRHRVTLGDGAYARSVTLTEDGRHALVADEAGILRTVETTSGQLGTPFDTGEPDAVAVRLTPPGELAFVAHRGGNIRALACAE